MKKKKRIKKVVDRTADQENKETRKIVNKYYKTAREEERTGKVKINERRALDLLTNYVDGRIKPKDEEERKILNQLLASAIKRLAQPGEKETTLPAVREISLTPEDKKKMMKWTPPKKDYLELPLAIVNARELTEAQEGEDGSLIEEYYQKGIPFIFSPLGPLNHLGKIIFYGIIPNLTRKLRGMSIARVNDYETIVKAKVKRGGKTYDLVEKEYRKIALFQYYHPSIITDSEGTGKTYYNTKKVALYSYTEDIKEKGRKEKDRIFARNPVLKSIKLWNQLTGYHLDNMLEATNTHELSLYIFLDPKLKPGNDCFPIGEDKLISHAEIHAKEKYTQRRDLKIALEKLEKDYGFLHGKPRENIYFFNRPRGPINKERRDQIIKLLNQGKSPTGKNFLEQWEKDQKEKEKNKKEEAQDNTRKVRMQAELYKAGIKMSQAGKITHTHEIDYLERMLKKAKSKNPKNPAPLFLHLIRNH